MTEAPSTEERYIVATNTSDLRVIADKRGAADVIIASAWAPGHIGGALMRLHTRPTRDGLAEVHTQVAMEADRLNIANPDAVASAVIAWFLDRVCPECHGRKFDTIKDTPSLSAIECPKCHGSGEKTIPKGESGRIMAAWLDRCKATHVDIIKRRLRPEGS